ncbi:hypothetical protein M0804_011598 [Polistes exclamans]|nr:hypothetical protein M0804_011598 [Polistes exclamans]
MSRYLFQRTRPDETRRDETRREMLQEYTIRTSPTPISIVFPSYSKLTEILIDSRCVTTGTPPATNNSTISSSSKQ